MSEIDWTKPIETVDGEPVLVVALVLHAISAHWSRLVRIGERGCGPLHMATDAGECIEINSGQMPKRLRNVPPLKRECWLVWTTCADFDAVQAFASCASAENATYECRRGGGAAHIQRVEFDG